jgi:hypothetical protein
LLIYLDTVLWNALCDEGADAKSLISALSTKHNELVLGHEAIYEMAKTFGPNPVRGRELFAYVRTFTELGILCPIENPEILRRESKMAWRGDQEQFDIFLKPADYLRLQQEVDKLSRGVIDQRVDRVIKSRKQFAADERAETSARYAIASSLKARLSRLSERDLEKEAKGMLGRRVLSDHLQTLYPESATRKFVIKRLLASPQYRFSNAVVRADVYANWRTVRNKSMPRDLLPDLDHIVAASYFDVYATKEAAHGKYAPLVLKRTRVAIWNGQGSVSAWLNSL